MRYGFQEEAERLAYKWLYMVTKAFVDFNGIVVEKYDVTRPIDPHKVDAEYGSKQRCSSLLWPQTRHLVQASWVLTIKRTHRSRQRFQRRGERG